MSMTLSVHASFRNATRHFSQPTYLFLCLQHNRGTRFDLTNDPLGGLAITANSEVAGPTGGFAWMMQLNEGSPKNLRIDQIEVHPDSPLILALPYPTGTSFSITANAYQWCNQNDQYLSCQEIFTEVDSLAKVRFGQGNVYFHDSTTNLLYVRVIQSPEAYMGDTLYSTTPRWRLWTLDDPDARSWSPTPYALDRFEFNGVMLPKFWSGGSYLNIQATCNEDNPGSKYCPMPQAYSVQSIEVCPSGYSQVAYDKCCLTSDLNTCYDFTASPSTSPTSNPTLDSCSSIVVNGDFENGLSSWHMNSGSATLELETTDRGNSSLCKDRTSTWMGVTQNLPLQAIEKITYRISCYAKIKSNTLSETTDYFKLTLSVQRENANTLYPGIVGTINNSGWTLISGTINLDITETITNVAIYAEGKRVT